MKQVAKAAGVIGRRFIEAGETFDHPERMKWAEPVAEPKPVKAGKGKGAEAPPPGPVETDQPGENEVI